MAVIIIAIYRNRKEGGRGIGRWRMNNMVGCQGGIDPNELTLCYFLCNGFPLQSLGAYMVLSEIINILTT
jgi:hypothetical protein